MSSSPADLLVIGGGIHGLFAAYDAAARGLSVRLVERADFGSGLSFNHQRTVHGGLRGLERGRLAHVRQQIAERRAWARMAPHLLRPLPFLIGTYRWSARSRTLLRAGFAVYDALGRHRNAGVTPELHLPPARLESVHTTRRLYPGIDARGLSGGALWYDYQAVHADRLNYVVALAARAAGADLRNYVEALAPLREGGRVIGARVRDLRSGIEQEIPSRTTLIAAGSGLPALAHAWRLPDPPPFTGAMNLLLDRPAHDVAVAGRALTGGTLTAVPWRGWWLVGTGQSAPPTETSAWPATPPASAVADLLADANLAFPFLQAGPQDIRLVHYGLTPAVRRGDRVDFRPDPLIHSVAPGLVWLVGVKFTTARAAAAHAVDLVCREQGRRISGSAVGQAALPYAGIADVEGRLTETLRALGVALDRDVCTHLAGWYGTEAPAVVRYAADHQLLERLQPPQPILAGEIAYAAEHAEALHLDDAVLRRTPFGSAGDPGREALARAAAIMGRVLGWTPAQQDTEVARVRERYGATGSEK
jgi:glycerol-3-phosphate dehydrogenase